MRKKRRRLSEFELAKKEREYKENVLDIMLMDSFVAHARKLKRRKPSYIG